MQNKKKNTPNEELEPAKLAGRSEVHVAREAAYIYIPSFISQLIPWSLLGIVVFFFPFFKLILYKYF